MIARQTYCRRLQVGFTNVLSFVAGFNDRNEIMHVPEKNCIVISTEFLMPVLERQHYVYVQI